MGIHVIFCNVIDSIVFVNMLMLKSPIIMVGQFVGTFVIVFSKMKMKKIAFICGGQQLEIMCKVCLVFSLKKAMKNKASKFFFENVYDKNIFVS